MNKYPQANIIWSIGPWYDAPVQPAYTVPAPDAGDVAIANGKTVTITTDVTCDELRNDTTGGATAGGSFTTSAAGITINASPLNATTNTLLSLNHAGGDVTVIAPLGCTAVTSAAIVNGSGRLVLTTTDIRNLSTINTNMAVLFLGVGSFTITATSVTGAVDGTGIQHNAGISINTNATGNTITVSGAVSSGPKYFAQGIYVSGGTGTVNISASQFLAGSASAQAYAFHNVGGTGTYNLTGAVYGNFGAGVNNASAGTVNIYGDVYAGSLSISAFGVNNASSGAVNIFGTVIGNDYGQGSTGISMCPAANNTGSGIMRVKRIKFGSRGASPTAGPVLMLDDPNDPNNNVCLMSKDLSGTYATMKNTASSDFGQAAPADVRYGTVYAGGNLTGTCRVPTAAQVANGIPVDNTTGTAALSLAQVTDAVGNVVSSLL